MASCIHCHDALFIFKPNQTCDIFHKINFTFNTFLEISLLYRPLQPTINMELSWDQFYGDSRDVTNASIICMDGVIQTHKLVVAYISGLLEHILRDIPCGDHATIYLTDFRKNSVEHYLCDAIQRKETNEKILQSILRPINHNSVKLEREQDSDPVKINIWGSNNSIDESSKNEIKEEFSRANDNNSSDEDGNNLDYSESEFEEEFNSKSLKRRSSSKVCSRTMAKKVKSSKLIKSNEFTLLNPEELDVFDRAMDEKIRQMEDQKIEDPSSTTEIAFNKRMDTKIRYEKAYAEVKSGRAKSYSEAAKRFGVCRQTIRKDDDFLHSEAAKRFGVGLQSEIRKDDDFLQSYEKLLQDGDNQITMDPKELADLDKTTEETIEGLKRERILNPSRPQDLAFNKNIDKKIRYERALAGVKSGRVKSCREAARMFGVCRQAGVNILPKI